MAQTQRPLFVPAFLAVETFEASGSSLALGLDWYFLLEEGFQVHFGLDELGTFTKFSDGFNHFGFWSDSPFQALVDNEIGNRRMNTS